MLASRPSAFVVTPRAKSEKKPVKKKVQLVFASPDKGKASFCRPRRGAGSSSSSCPPVAPSGIDDIPLDRVFCAKGEWDAMDLAGQVALLPEHLRPVGNVPGMFSYNLKCRTNLSVVEVLLRHRAFFIQRLADGSRLFGAGRHVGWKKHGGLDAAWHAAKVCSGWDDAK